MIRRPSLTIAITAIFLMGFIPWYLQNDVQPSNHIIDSESEPLMTSQSIQKNHESILHKTTPKAHSPSAAKDNTFDTQLAQELITKYSDNIDDLAVQANLFKVREFVVSRYPEDGMARFERIINLAFPTQASSIMKLVELMATYTHWLAENYTQLNAMSPLERDGNLWEKRRELFGKDADIIWSNEREMLAKKQRNMQEEIHRLGLATELSMDEALYQLQTTITDTYGQTAQDLVIDPGMIAGVFFNFDSVQQNLQNMSQEQRQTEINRVRQQLGYNEEQVETAQEKDKERNQRWDNGLAYMAKRQQLVDTLDSDALESALSTLRDTYFKQEAYTIAKEETAGFYRYARPRIYGRN